MSDETTGLKGQLAEAMKKVVLAGVGTIFMTEETIRNTLGEMKLPKEMWSGLMENAGKTKAEFLNSFAREAANVLSKVDFANEAKRFFEGHSMKINIEVKFDKRDGFTVEKAPEENAESSGS